MKYVIAFLVALCCSTNALADERCTELNYLLCPKAPALVADPERCAEQWYMFKNAGSSNLGLIGDTPKACWDGPWVKKEYARAEVKVAYIRYIFFVQCLEARKPYKVTYVDEEMLSTAKRMTKNLEWKYGGDHEALFTEALASYRASPIGKRLAIHGGEYNAELDNNCKNNAVTYNRGRADSLNITKP